MKHISIALCLCGMILMNTSCDNYDDTYPQEYEKILSLQTTGEQAVDLYKTGEATNYSITVIKSGSNPTLTASAHIGAMDAANFEQYISERGLNYVAMPADCYSFNMEDLDYSSAETYKIINLQLNTSEIDRFEQTLEEGQTCVLPIMLTSTSDSILADKNTLILKPEVIIPSLSVTESSSGTVTKYLPQSGGTISLSLGLQVENQWSFTCKVAIDEATTTLQGATLASDIISFEPGNTSSVQVNIPKFTQTSGNVGIKILEINGKDGFEFNPDPFILVASVEKYNLTTDMLSSNATEPSEGSLANLLDGDVGTYFHSAWSVSVADKHYVQVKLPVSTKTFRFTYTNRSNNGNAALAWFNLYTGATENNLQLDKRFAWDVDNLPSGAAGVYVSPDITIDNAASTLRFECEQNWTGGSFFVWSEFSLFILSE